MPSVAFIQGFSGYFYILTLELATSSEGGKTIPGKTPTRRQFLENFFSILRLNFGLRIENIGPGKESQKSLRRGIRYDILRSRNVK